MKIKQVLIVSTQVWKHNAIEFIYLLNVKSKILGPGNLYLNVFIQKEKVSERCFHFVEQCTYCDLM